MPSAWLGRRWQSADSSAAHTLVHNVLMALHATLSTSPNIHADCHSQHYVTFNTPSVLTCSLCKRGSQDTECCMPSSASCLAGSGCLGKDIRLRRVGAEEAFKLATLATRVMWNKQALSSGQVVPTEQEIGEGGLSNTDKRNRGCCRKAWTAAKIRVPKLCSNKLS